MPKPNGKQKNGRKSLSYQYQQSYLLQHSHERKQNKTNDANLWHTTIKIHFDINTLAKGNLANTQSVRIKVTLVQQKFTASLLSSTFTILFFLISHDLFHTLFKEVWREYMYLFLTPSLNLPKNRANIIFKVTESCLAESFHNKPQLILWFQQTLGTCCHTLEKYLCKMSGMCLK